MLLYLFIPFVYNFNLKCNGIVITVTMSWTVKYQGGDGSEGEVMHDN